MHDTSTTKEHRQNYNREVLVRMRLQRFSNDPVNANVKLSPTVTPSLITKPT